jgi:hypothetical protein
MVSILRRFPVQVTLAALFVYALTLSHGVTLASPRAASSAALYILFILVLGFEGVYVFAIPSSGSSALTLPASGKINIMSKDMLRLFYDHGSQVVIYCK